MSKIKMDKMSVSKGKAFDNQCKASDSYEKPSLGFDTSKVYQGDAHFSKEEYLRQGHNDSGSMDMDKDMDSKMDRMGKMDKQEPVKSQDIHIPGMTELDLRTGKETKYDARGKKE